MTRTRLIAAGVMIAAATLLSAGCSPQQTPRQDQPSTEQTPATTPEQTSTEQGQSRAEKLWMQIQDENYRSWGRPPGYSGRTASKGPHGDQVEIFVNPTMEQALKDGPLEEWPKDSIIVKDGFDAGTIESVSVMQKVDGGWYFAEYEPDGNVKIDGVQQPACAACHKAGDDYVRSFKLPK